MAAETTMQSWPVLIDDQADIPESWVQETAGRLGCRYAVYFPSQAYGLFKRHSIVLGIKDEHFIYTDSKRTFDIPFSEVITCKHLRVLLSGKLMIKTLTKTYRVDYNLTKERIVEPFVQRFREYAIKNNVRFDMDQGVIASFLKDHADSIMFSREGLYHQNLKMFNYLTEQLPEGHGKELIYYQESIEQSSLQRRLHLHHYFTPYMIVRTEQEILLFNEQQHVSKKPEEYGLQINYFIDSDHIRWGFERRSHSGEMRIMYDDHTLFKLHIPFESMDRAYEFCQLLNS